MVSSRALSTDESSARRLTPCGRSGHGTDGTKRLCHIRGKLHKKVWMSPGDIVLLSKREYQDGKADVIFKYSYDEARELKAMGELPESGTMIALSHSGLLRSISVH